MFNSHYIDDIFIDLYVSVTGSMQDYMVVQTVDRRAIESFYTTLSNGGSLTESQAKYILRLLQKYKHTLTRFYDYTDLLKDPKWSKPFRVIDLTRRIWVEQERNEIMLALKFPYSVKDHFDNDIISTDYTRIRSKWDSERKVRLVNAYDLNLTKLNIWLEEHGFEIDETYEDFIATVDEILNDDEEILPGSIVENGSVTLINPHPEALTYFNSNKSNNVENDLFLAKSMGFTYKGKPESTIEKICSFDETKFRIPDLGRAFLLSESIVGKKVIILDRASDYHSWMKNLYNFLINHNIDVNKFVFCHRENNSNNPEFNEWIKEVGFGGKTDEAEYLIFVHRPRKWLFSNEVDVKIVFTTGLWDSRDNITRAFLDSSCCEISLAESKPTENRYPHPEWHQLGGNAERVDL
jgi:hypothetical protein